MISKDERFAQVINVQKSFKANTTVPIKTTQRYPYKVLNYKMEFCWNVEAVVKLGLN